ncbi:MAG: creatininase family protein [Candidatus Dormibacteraceae bacterium]
MGKAAIHRLDELTWTEVEALDRTRSAVFLLSSPIEQHGPHLPLGTDLIQAGSVMRLVASRVCRQGWNVLLAPPIPYTTAVLSRGFAGSTSVRSRHLEGYFTDVIASFSSNGFANVVVFSQHLDPPHVLAWERACAEAAEAGARAIEGYERLIFDDLRTGALNELFGSAGAGDSHAGIFETSVVMAARPGLVRRDVAAALPAMPVDFDRELRAAASFKEIGDGRGYTGAPAAATEAIGRALLRRYSRSFGDLVLAHLRGEDVREQVSIAGSEMLAG